MAMSKKHYKAVAEVLKKQALPDGTHFDLIKDIAKDFATFFKQDNSNFNKEKFFSACGIDQ